MNAGAGHAGRGASESDAPSGARKVDESWKDKARREKEELASQEDATLGEIPAASFLGLLEELSLRVMLALGQMPNPATGEYGLDLEAARYTIDLMGVLEEKTKGNLTPEESAALSELLQRLRISFVHSSQSPPASDEPAAEDDAAGGRLII